MFDSFISDKFRSNDKDYQEVKVLLLYDFIIIFNALLFGGIFYFLGNTVSSLSCFSYSIILTANLYVFKYKQSYNLLFNVFSIFGFFLIGIMINTSGGILNNYLFSWYFVLFTLMIFMGRNIGLLYFLFSLIVLEVFFSVYFESKGFNLPNYNNINFRQYLDISCLVFPFLVEIVFLKVFKDSLNKVTNELEIEKSSIQIKIDDAVKEIEVKNETLNSSSLLLEENNDELNKQREELLKTVQENENSKLLLQKERDNVTLNKKYLDEKVNVILDKMKLFSLGDLTVELPIERNDSIGKLFEGFNLSVRNIRNLFNNVITTIDNTNEVTNEIKHLTESLKIGVENQQFKTEQVASSSEEIVTTSISNSKSTLFTSESSTENKEIAKEGVEIVNSTIEKIDQIANAVIESSHKISELNISTKKIIEIVSFIDDIADQTNLLSLNASIESARAGEHGKGFSVVSREIRILAEKITNATKEISETINNVRRQSEDSIKIMEKVNGLVILGTKSSKEAGKALEKIVISSDSLLEMINQIAAASEEQAVTNQDISNNIFEISEISKEASNQIYSVFNNIEHLSKLMVTLDDVSQKFKV